MSLDGGMVGKTITAGVAKAIEDSGSSIALTATLTANIPKRNNGQAKRLTWSGTGNQWHSSPTVKSVDAGTAIQFDSVPATNSTGWRLDGATPVLGSTDHVFTYTLAVSAKIGVKSVSLLSVNFVLSESDPDTIDVDTLLEAGATTGATISVVDQWSALVDAATTAAVANDAGVAALIASGTATPAALDAAYAPVPRTFARAVGQGEIAYNVLDYKTPSNTLDDAVTAAIAAMPTLSDAFGASGQLRFPAGYHEISAGLLTSPSGKRFSIVGDGPYKTILRLKDGSVGDFITLNGNSDGIGFLTVDANRFGCPSGGDAIVMNGAYTWLLEVHVEKAKVNNITIGKAGAAIAHQLTNVKGRLAGQHGIETVAGSGCTDGLWTGLDIGQSGHYGIKLDEGSINGTNVHVWGSGLESATEYHGFYVNSASNTFTVWQSEKNNGSGLFFTTTAGRGSSFTGGRAWGNALCGIDALAAPFVTCNGNQVYRNGVTNTGGTTATSFAGIRLQGATYWTVVGNNVWDDTVAISAGAYPSGYVPTYPYPGRAGGSFTQSWAYVEASAADNNLVSGNQFPKERHIASTGPLSISSNSGVSDLWGPNYLGSVAAPTVSVASNTIVIPGSSDFVIVNSTSGITSITGGRAGRRVTILFANAAPGTVTDNGTTLNLNGSFVPTQNDTLTLVSDGTNWYEVSRSAN